MTYLLPLAAAHGSSGDNGITFVDNKPNSILLLICRLGGPSKVKLIKDTKVILQRLCNIENLRNVLK